MQMATQTRYPPTHNTVALRQAIITKLARENDLSDGLDEVIVSNGAKQVLFNAMMATLDDGDEVLLCAPYFGRHKDIVLILGGRPVTLPCPASDGVHLKPGAIAAVPGSACELEPFFASRLPPPRRF
jgi:aspartate aminotransferase